MLALKIASRLISLRSNYLSLFAFFRVSSYNRWGTLWPHSLLWLWGAIFLPSSDPNHSFCYERDTLGMMMMMSSYAAIGIIIYLILLNSLWHCRYNYDIKNDMPLPGRFKWRFSRKQMHSSYKKSMEKKPERNYV